jgi:opacity protein-like surface antigen
MQSSRSRLMLVALFGALALGALTAAAAQAVEAPRWSITGTILRAGKTHFITAKAYTTTTPFTLTAGGFTVSCKGLNLKAGSLLGSEPESAGKNNEAMEFTGCSVSGKGITKCVVMSPAAGIVLTTPIRSELVETEKAKPDEDVGSLLTLFEPEVGAILANLKFKTETGGTCPPETNVTGSVAGQVLVDLENGKLGELVELGQATKEAPSWLLNFPATPIQMVTRIDEGKITEKAPGLRRSFKMKGCAF